MNLTNESVKKSVVKRVPNVVEPSKKRSLPKTPNTNENISSTQKGSHKAVSLFGTLPTPPCIFNFDAHSEIHSENVHDPFQSDLTSTCDNDNFVLPEFPTCSAIPPPPSPPVLVNIAENLRKITRQDFVINSDDDDIDWDSKSKSISCSELPQIQKDFNFGEELGFNTPPVRRKATDMTPGERKMKQKPVASYKTNSAKHSKEPDSKNSQKSSSYQGL
jgi:hypothetical protein